MNFTTRQSNIRKLDNSDPRFMIHDGFVVVPRAGFEISENCPAEYKSIFVNAIKAGWVKPIAHVHERELIFMGLSK